MTRAAVGSLEIFRLCFPPSFSHGVIDPATGYLAVVLEGAVHKSFRHTSSTLTRGSFMSIPAGAAHSSAFAPAGCRVVIVRATGEGRDRLFGAVSGDCTKVVAHMSTRIGWEISKELECRDASSRLALEGLALELLACAGRAGSEPRDTSWLGTVRDLLHEATPRIVSLGELGEIAERHPAHVARVFKEMYGVSVTAYARARRLEWATVAVASSDDPLARIAFEAGFADQSHFTRAFGRHHGVTPGHYRRLVRA